MATVLEKDLLQSVMFLFNDSSLVWAGFVVSLPSSYPSLMSVISTIMHSHKPTGLARYQKPRKQVGHQIPPDAVSSKAHEGSETAQVPGIHVCHLIQKSRHHSAIIATYSLAILQKQGRHARIALQLAIFVQPQGTKVLVTHTSRHTKNDPRL